MTRPPAVSGDPVASATMAAAEDLERAAGTLGARIRERDLADALAVHLPAAVVERRWPVPGWEPMPGNIDVWSADPSGRPRVVVEAKLKADNSLFECLWDVAKVLSLATLPHVEAGYIVAGTTARNWQKPIECAELFATGRHELVGSIERLRGWWERYILGDSTARPLQVADKVDCELVASAPLRLAGIPWEVRAIRVVAAPGEWVPFEHGLPKRLRPSRGSTNSTSVQDHAAQALTERLRQRAGDAAVDSKGRADSLEQNLVPCMRDAQVAQVRRDLGQGAGGELRPSSKHRPPMHSAYSSAALVANAFGCWLGHEELLSLAGVSGFSRLTFERKLPIGDGGGVPNLDLFAEGDGGAVAVESKCLEYLSPKPAKFKPVYEQLAPRMHPTWRAEFEAVLGDAGRPISDQRYRHLDVAQLIKHYLGVQGGFPEGRAQLHYLYWEPLDADRFPSVQRHREEVAAFARRVEGDPDIGFSYESYTELFDAWEARNDVPWLPEHIHNLSSRYELELR